jgi:hypothetical protein
MDQKTDTAGVEADRRRRTIEVPSDLESRFLRVGNKLYRSPHDKEPMATITPDRIKAKDREALPDLIRLAKENGWTSLRIEGDEEFKRAAYLAATAQGLKIDGYLAQYRRRRRPPAPRTRFATARSSPSPNAI